MNLVEIDIQILRDPDAVPGSEPNTDSISLLSRRLLRDAQYGTQSDLAAGTIPPAWWVDPPDLLQQTSEVVESSAGWSFTLRIARRLFPTEGGIQHLVGLLANLTEPRDGKIVPRVTRVFLPQTWQAELRGHYRSNANSSAGILSAFQLSDRPLLAFTFKPRFGLTTSAFREVALSVAKAGFDLIEPDTRDILRPDQTEALLELAVELPKVNRKKVVRFAPNLTLPSYLLRGDSFASEFLEKFFASTPPPHVLKIDGGLDGFSAVQAIRSDKRFARFRPIITCYPLLREKTEPYLPRSSFNDLLFLSGVDLLYPGGRPRFREGKIAMDAFQRYQRFCQDGTRGDAPMVSFAGDTNPSELHCYVRFLGPGVPLFLGGAVALNIGGYSAGAKLCVDVVTASARQTNGPLPESLILRIEKEYGEHVRTPYVNPDKCIFAQ